MWETTGLFSSLNSLTRTHWHSFLWILILRCLCSITAMPEWAIFKTRSQLQASAVALVPAQAQLGSVGPPRPPSLDFNFTKMLPVPPTCQAFHFQAGIHVVQMGALLDPFLVWLAPRAFTSLLKGHFFSEVLVAPETRFDPPDMCSHSSLS